MPTMVWSLGWRDVDPSMHPFDQTRLANVVQQTLRGVRARASGSEIEDAIDRALLSAFGFWAAGWRWSASEPGGGGPVRGWCCARDS
jgi:hypothetical protein